ncbi:AMP-binding protein [Bauldia sp.]|uniref:AMP-binding protein n=1 Tax=Bauldia sp. TaxID=2575872 RepID=UPI003BAD4682
MLDRVDSYDSMVAGFRWPKPKSFNIATVCCDRWAAAYPDRAALLRWDGHDLHRTTFADLKRQSDDLAQALRKRGVGQGDRVAVLLPQSVETVVAHLAAYKLGAIVVPMAALFGTDALAFRLTDSGASALITDGPGLAKLAELDTETPALATILCVDGPAANAEDYHETVSVLTEPLTSARMAPDDPAMMIYTSGTTGHPKGALHGHRVLLGHLPGFAFTHEHVPQANDRVWTPSDWAWAGGLLNALLPALFFGVPVVFGPAGRFDPEAAFALMAGADVRNAFLPPTAIKLMNGVANPRQRFDFNLRTVAAAGETLGRAAFETAPAVFGRPVNEFYGQTECNYVIGSSAAFGLSRAGAIGKPIPGHHVAVVDRDGQPLPPDQPGEIAVRRPNPSMFLGYWQNEAATREKFIGDWMMTGDEAVRDHDGYIHFIGRNDDIIISSGYRIGPAEVEECLASHPAVAMAAVIGKPDPVRTEIVTAFVALKPGFTRSDLLAEEIRSFVRSRLSAAEYPREITFVDTIPLTTSGKVIRRAFRDRVRQDEPRVSSP